MHTQRSIGSYKLTEDIVTINVAMLSGQLSSSVSFPRLLQYITMVVMSKARVESMYVTSCFQEDHDDDIIMDVCPSPFIHG